MSTATTNCSSAAALAKREVKRVGKETSVGAARGYLAPVLVYLAVAGGLLLNGLTRMQGKQLVGSLHRL